jgi:hypothetical protein
VVLYVLNCAFFNAFFVYRTLSTNINVKYKYFLREVEGPRYQKSRIEVNSKLQLTEKQTTPSEPKEDLSGRLSRDFRIHKLGKNVS